MLPFTCVVNNVVEGMVFGCLNCSSGMEERVTEQLKRRFDGLDAFAVRQVHHQSRNGLKKEVIKVMLPGYVFIRAPADMNVFAIRQNINGVIRILTYDNQWALQGTDLDFAEWVWDHHGLLGLSQVHKLGERVVIKSGPLKDMEGMIRKIDRHNRNGLVCIEFAGRQINVWLAFEYIASD